MITFISGLILGFVYAAGRLAYKISTGKLKVFKVNEDGTEKEIKL